MTAAKTEGPVYAFVGLGNPGPRYADTRHNFGFMFIDHLSRALGVPVEDTAIAGAVSGHGVWNGHRIILVKPITYMNLSGRAVARLLEKRPEAGDNLWVAHDDLDLELGWLRIRPGGGSGGHRGVAHIQQVLGHQQFGRFRLGIGRPPGGRDPADYVLAPFEPSEEPLVLAVLDRAVAAAQVLMAEGPEAAMSRFNGPVAG
ncbi:MAG TPA: aminoacyl-tRNA hydrolase [Sphingobacteriaceae bacterium]|nr:aminoacyl-tRNA hydrolase [Sphingobacteriaceae bacterium]